MSSNRVKFSGEQIYKLGEGNITIHVVLIIAWKMQLFCRYGVGYHMTLVKDRTCDSHKVESLVISYILSAKMVTDVGMELSFILPSSAASKFPELFEKLESKLIV